MHIYIYILAKVNRNLREKKEYYLLLYQNSMVMTENNFLIGEPKRSKLSGISFIATFSNVGNKFTNQVSNL